MFNQSFETGRRTVFKVGGGFEILGYSPWGKRGWFKTIKLWFQSTSTFEIFQGTSRFEKSVQILDVGLYRDYKALVH